MLFTGVSASPAGSCPLWCFPLVAPHFAADTCPASLELQGAEPEHCPERGPQKGAECKRTGEPFQHGHGIARPSIGEIAECSRQGDPSSDSEYRFEYRSRHNASGNAKKRGRSRAITRSCNLIPQMLQASKCELLPRRHSYYLTPVNISKLIIWIMLAMLLAIGIYLFVQADASDWSQRL
ncbi:hypothetical protein [Mesorhizobium sp. B2-3-12]|uniref:hypothetical protein n=1 Tax=Mesorhizobium sp. B2-3-12 TaxID=2589952 RepID=UPI00112818BF|nr:hypothetical protein [Mesorhizobium sp. B2-3-12]TPL88637.1 hypothetical protein FJ948_20665 [Mesorhizobium sp. B2-3-12]